MPANRRKIDTNKLSQTSLHDEANLLFLMVLCLNQTQRDKNSMCRELVVCVAIVVRTHTKRNPNSRFKSGCPHH